MTRGARATAESACNGAWPKAWSRAVAVLGPGCPAPGTLRWHLPSCWPPSCSLPPPTLRSATCVMVSSVLAKGHVDLLGWMDGRTARVTEF